MNSDCPPAPAEKAGDGRLLKRAGKKRPFFAVGCFADGCADQKIAQLREKGEIVARCEALVGEP